MMGNTEPQNLNDVQRANIQFIQGKSIGHFGIGGRNSDSMGNEKFWKKD